jgi:SAM-dependent methyltransferase
LVGVDLSERLLAIARQYEAAEPLGVRYVRDDARSLRGVADASFDGVTCSLALMDIPDLPAVLATVYRILIPGGWFAFSITHPCFQIPRTGTANGDGGGAVLLGGYFAEGFWRSDYPEGVRGKVGAYHRTLSTYLNALSVASLILERVIEPPPSVPATAEQPVPKFLLARCRKEQGRQN